MERSVLRLTSSAAVLRALELYDNLGADEFLARYGFGRSRGYVLVHNGRHYDSKAIAGVAYGFQHPESGPLRADEFHGGRSGAALALRRLCFEVIGAEAPAASTPKAAVSEPLGAPGSEEFEGPRVLLLGCVKGKGPRPAPARDLYTSDLFRKRRAYAVAAGHPWFILSALHGLVAPDDVLEPYDMALAKQPAAYRVTWGQQVMEALERRLRPLTGLTFEVHAGAPYVEAIRGQLEAHGARVVWPLHGLTQGQQLSWYLSPPAERMSSRHPERPTAAEVEAAVAALTAPDASRSPEGFPWGRADLDQPGLYAWFVDDRGAADLALASGEAVSAGLVYAGQAGATAWPSGKQPQSTLLSRIRGNHLGGRVTASTWRLSLAALLRAPLDLQMCHGDLDGRSGTALTRWMTEHLRLAIYVSPDRGGLAGLEHAVLARLDPPLNLDGMTPTPLRALLTARRKALLAPPGQLT